MTTNFDDSNITSVRDLLPLIYTAEVFNIKASCPQKERSDWIRERLIRFKYCALTKSEKSILKQYLGAVTGLKERTLKYHITAYKEGRQISHSYKRNTFATIYSNDDKELLAETDNLHSRLNGNATKEIYQAMYDCGDKRYARLKDISTAHLYNLRQTRLYKEQALDYEKTKPNQVPIGKREKPEPAGKPGYIRVDTVHQGDKDGEKGVYHINLVDEVTQWEVMAAVPEISAKYLAPILEMCLELFPFVIINFHSDRRKADLAKVMITDW